jgi:hypothetical protein
MLSLTRPLGRVPFILGVSLANSALLLVILLSFAFLPSGAGHIAVLVIVGALMGWWFSLHARRFATAGRSVGWPAMVAAVCFLTFAVSYLTIAALWSVPDVQQAAFRTGGSDYTRHVESWAVVSETGRWLAGWLGATTAVLFSGFLAMVMSVVALASAFFSVIALVLPSRNPAPMLSGRVGIPGR